MSSLILAATLVLAGCNPPPPPISGTTSTTGSVKTYMPDANGGGSTGQNVPNGSTNTGGTTGEPGGQDPAAQKAGQHRFVPERVFQLDKLKKATVKLGKHEFHLWVMDTDSKRSEGMMFLKKEDFKDDEGMIFVFPNEGDAPRRFWMRNTLVDLDIAYCDRDGTINSTYTMKSLDEDTDYSSKRPSMYVIELRDGTFKRLEIKPGMRFIIPEDVVARD